MQLLVQELVALGPVDGVVRVWEVERHELRERALDGLFPGDVVLVGGAGFRRSVGRTHGVGRRFGRRNGRRNWRRDGRRNGYHIGRDVICCHAPTLGTCHPAGHPSKRRTRPPPMGVAGRIRSPPARHPVDHLGPRQCGASERVWRRSWPTGGLTCQPLPAGPDPKRPVRPVNRWLSTRPLTFAPRRPPCGNMRARAKGAGFGEPNPCLGPAPRRYFSRGFRGQRPSPWGSLPSIHRRPRP